MIKFWKTIKPLFSNPTWSAEKITLVEVDTISTQDVKNADIFITFFSNLVKNLKIPVFEEVNPFAEKYLISY